jgi:hypothetical protein
MNKRLFLGIFAQVCFNAAFATGENNSFDSIKGESSSTNDQYKETMNNLLFGNKMAEAQNVDLLDLKEQKNIDILLPGMNKISIIPEFSQIQQPVTIAAAAKNTDEKRNSQAMQTLENALIVNTKTSPKPQNYKDKLEDAKKVTERSDLAKELYITELAGSSSNNSNPSIDTNRSSKNSSIKEFIDLELNSVLNFIKGVAAFIYFNQKLNNGRKEKQDEQFCHSVLYSELFVNNSNGNKQELMLTSELLKLKSDNEQYENSYEVENYTRVKDKTSFIPQQTKQANYTAHLEIILKTIFMAIAVFMTVIFVRKRRIVNFYIKKSLSFAKIAAFLILLVNLNSITDKNKITKNQAIVIFHWNVTDMPS